MFTSLRILCTSRRHTCVFFFFFFNDTATTEIYTLSLHDALPILSVAAAPSIAQSAKATAAINTAVGCTVSNATTLGRSEEHTSELQSLTNLVCRLLLEKKKQKTNQIKSEQTNNPEIHSHNKEKQQ